MTDNTIPIQELIHRRLYVLDSRNLLVGAWDANKQDFIGIRNKFNRFFLDRETHWDVSPTSGTAVAVKDLKVTVPVGVPLIAHVGSFGETTGREAVHLKENNTYVYRYADTNQLVDQKQDPVFLRENQALFKILEPFNNVERKRVAEENARYSD